MSGFNQDAYKLTVNLHERDFQRYSVTHRVYCVPVDEEEEDRLEAQHDVIQRLFAARSRDLLFFPPLDYPMRILDCGYGRGQWAVAMAETYTDSRVTAIDIYPAELPDQPDNLDCEVWNLNEPLIPTYPANTYDLIHSRFLAPGIKRTRWPDYVKDLKRLLRPNGWVQMVEYYYNFQSDSGLLTDGSAIRRWYEYYRSAMEVERNPRVGSSLQGLMRSANLVDVQGLQYSLPIGPWSNDPTLRKIGEDNLANISELLDSHAIWPFTQRLGWTKEQVEAFTDEARAEVADMRFRLYMPV
ncbi:S-adenosyl-L-methionine-dependent methyltransferase [Glonium stellatum]|uniref:S-adenosyl-L-methionine-dependent methyltransferase n=1 Tax=Glonium stellatum TaxID=574774 RepID=A0A8E2JV92_9PEZI|nr:S-adenosyl-L-methionine-dependent methyltransferase [Glonium stellatum]